MQKALSPNSSAKSSHFGGIFAPLAQYPGASYAKLLAEKIEQDTPMVPQVKAPTKTFIRSNTPRTMQKITLPFKTALLLVDSESNANLDRAALRDAGLAQVRVLTSGVKAAKILSAKDNTDETIDIVFCHPRFEDMSAVQWIELIRSHPALKHLPVVSLVGSLAEQKLLQAVLRGFDDSLTRPYSPKVLQDKLIQLSKLYEEERRVDLPSQLFDIALSRFENRKTEEGKAGFYMEEGLRFMTEKKWDNAVQSFNKAMLHPEYKGDAELGLAAAWRGNQDTEKFHYYLYEASLTFTRAAKWTKARSAYKHVLRTMQKTPSPFIRTMQSLIRAGKYADAATTLIAGLDLSKHENIANHIAKACLYTENPPYTLQKVKQFFNDPALKDIVKSLDEHLHQAFVTHQNSVNKAREAKAKLEQKARKQLKAAAAIEPVPNPVINPVLDDLPDPDLAKYKIADEYADDESILDDIPGKPSLMQDDYVKRQEREGVIPLMNSDDLESQMFSSFPGLNEAATVIKTTWKLMKK